MARLRLLSSFSLFFFFNDTATTEIYTLSLHDALPIFFLAGYLREKREVLAQGRLKDFGPLLVIWGGTMLVLVERSEEHTSELQSRPHLVCRLLLEKKKHNTHTPHPYHPTPLPQNADTR